RPDIDHSQVGGAEVDTVDAGDNLGVAVGKGDRLGAIGAESVSTSGREVNVEPPALGVNLGDFAGDTLVKVEGAHPEGTDHDMVSGEELPATHLDRRAVERSVGLEHRSGEAPAAHALGHVAGNHRLLVFGATRLVPAGDGPV